MGISDWWQGRQQLKAIKNRRVLGPVLEYLQHDLRDDRKYTIFALASESSKKGEIVANILGDIERRLFVSVNPIIPLRERALEILYLTGSLHVLTTKGPAIDDKPDYSLNPTSRFISGELHSHILELAPLDNHLKSLFYEADLVGASYADSWNLIVANFQINHLWANAFVTALVAIGDKTQNIDHDWVPQCYRSFCICCENGYRKLLGWRSLIDDNEIRAAAKAVMHMSWINKVKEDDLAIRMSWEDEWERVFGDRGWS